MLRDPDEDKRNNFNDLAMFTGREPLIGIFSECLNKPKNRLLTVLVFYGVPGIGKTMLCRKLSSELDGLKPALPYARFDMSRVENQTQSYREVLLQLRSDLQNNFGIQFPKFDLCLAVMVAREGGEAPPLLRNNPDLYDAFQFATTLIQAPLQGIGRFVEHKIQQTPMLETLVRKAGGTEEVIELKRRALQDDMALPEELVRRFGQDLKRNLPLVKDKACRCVLFLDNYEALWLGRQHNLSAQSYLLDAWVRNMAEYLMNIGVQLVLFTRDAILWGEQNQKWNSFVKQHHLGGLSYNSAQTYLARRGVGNIPDEGKASKLQQAIIDCCNSALESEHPVDCHLLYLALCAEIVLNNRAEQGIDPTPDTFSTIPSGDVESELASCFLKSLYNRSFELWLIELSLCPYFNKPLAIALDEKRHFNGRGGLGAVDEIFICGRGWWSYHLHRIIRDILRTRLPINDKAEVHNWFALYWDKADENALELYHHWHINPEKAISEWKELYEQAFKQGAVVEQRHLLSRWEHILRYMANHGTVKDVNWAKTHYLVGESHTKVMQYRTSSDVIEHFEGALLVFNKAQFPYDWAITQYQLGIIYKGLHEADFPNHFAVAGQYFESALEVFTNNHFPKQWADVQMAIGELYTLQINNGNEIPKQQVEQYFQVVLQAYEKAGTIISEADYPKDWAMLQRGLGVLYKSVAVSLPGLPVDKRERLILISSEHLRACLRVYDETSSPQKWAETQFSLINNSINLAHGSRVETLNTAITQMKDVLIVLEGEDNSITRGFEELNLAVVFASLYQIKQALGLDKSGRIENLREAINYIKSGTEICTNSQYIQLWAQSQCA